MSIKVLQFKKFVYIRTTPTLGFLGKHLSVASLGYANTWFLSPTQCFWSQLLLSPKAFFSNSSFLFTNSSSFPIEMNGRRAKHQVLIQAFNMGSALGYSVHKIKLLCNLSSGYPKMYLVSLLVWKAQEGCTDLASFLVKISPSVTRQHTQMLDRVT